MEDRPFSMNTHYLSDYRSKFLAHYKGSRESYEHTDIMKVIRSFSSSSNSSLKMSFNGLPTGIAKVLAGLAEMGINGVKPEDLPKLLPADKMEPALAIMADVRAYFQGMFNSVFIYFFICTANWLTFFWLLVWISVAYKRFADNIPLAIDLELVRGLERGIHSTLYTHIGVSGPDATRVCQKLAEEFPAVARDRADLLKKLERLESASKELLYFGV